MFWFCQLNTLNVSFPKINLSSQILFPITFHSFFWTNSKLLSYVSRIKQEEEKRHVTWKFKVGETNGGLVF